MELPLILGLCVQGCILVCALILAIGCIRGIIHEREEKQHSSMM